MGLRSTLKMKEKVKFFLKYLLARLSPKLFHWIRIRRFEATLPKEFLDHLKKLDTDSLVIDLGANVGLVTELLAKTGAEVIAFEPNKFALSNLNLVSERFHNIQVKPFAAGIKDEKVKLFLHKDSIDSSEDLSQSSSLMDDKPNVSTELTEEVNEIDFAEFLQRINRKINLIKIDIEGYEIDLLNHLLDKNSLKFIDKVYVETHERKFTALEKPTYELKDRIEREGLSQKFFFDWH